MNLRLVSLAALTALLGACATQTVRPTLPASQIAAAEAAQHAREVALRDDARWALEGRIAVSNGRDGGSGRIDWRQDGARYLVSLSAPVTRQSWQISGDPGQALLEGLEGGPRVGSDAAMLLRDATGWDIPVIALSDWVRGLRAPALGPAEVVYDIDGRLSRLQQGGWSIDYTWPDSAGPLSGVVGVEPVLPARLHARRGEASVRLIVDAWNPAPGS